MFLGLSELEQSCRAVDVLAASWDTWQRRLCFSFPGRAPVDRPPSTLLLPAPCCWGSEREVTLGTEVWPHGPRARLSTSVSAQAVKGLVPGWGAHSLLLSVFGPGVARLV